MISYQIKQKIIDNTDIVEVIKEYIPLQKKGNSFKGLCPFHADNNPSMSVSKEKKVYNCFSCGEKGTVINFVSKYENISEEAACIKLGKRIGIEINQNVNENDLKNERLFKVMREAADFYHFYLRNSEEGLIALKYLHDRGINDELIDKFKLGLSPSANNYLHMALNSKKISELDQIELGLVSVNENTNEVFDLFRNRIMFPIKDQYGRFVAFSGRLYTESNQAKYINSIETPIFHKSDVLYNFYNAANHIRKENKVYILEGFMDVFAMEKAGVLNSVATMGTALTKEHLKQILGLTKNIILCFDGDNAGISATKRAAALFRSNNITPSAVILPDGLDPDDYLKKYGDVSLVNYLSTKSKDVYNILYDSAKKNLRKTDLISVEDFKKEVFGFLKSANSETIVSYFLKKLAEDLDLNEDLVVRDYQNLAPYNGAVVHQVEQNKTVFQPSNKVRNKKTSAKAIMAYKIILRYCIVDRGCFETLISKELNMFPENSFINLYSIYVIISNFYYSENIDKIGNEVFINAIKDDENIYELGKEILEKKEYYNGDITLFDEVVETYERYLNSLSLKQAKKVAIESKSDKDINEYQNLISEKKTIKREEK